MDLNLNDIKPKLSFFWQKHFDQIIIAIVLILTLALAGVGTYAVFQFLISPSTSDDLDLPDRSLDLKQGEIDEAINNIDDRSKPVDTNRIDEIKDPFPKD